MSQIFFKIVPKTPLLLRCLNIVVRLSKSGWPVGWGNVVAIVGGEGEVAGIVGGYAFNAPCGANKQEVKTIVFSHVRMVRSFYLGPSSPWTSSQVI